MTMTNAMGVDPLLAGGAVLAGVYVGDRCSPVSTSAALVAIVTHTSLYANIRRMFITGALPMALAVLLWTALGFLLPGHAVDLNITSVFARQFDLSLVTTKSAGSPRLQSSGGMRQALPSTWFV